MRSGYQTRQRLMDARIISRYRGTLIGQEEEEEEEEKEEEESKPRGK